MTMFVLILISIFNWTHGGDDIKQEPTNYSAHNYRNMINLPIVSDIGPHIWENIDTVELIQMIYHPVGSNVHKQQIAQELHKRVEVLNPNTFKENMRLLFEIYRQRTDGNKPHYVAGIEDKIASNVRMDVQRRVNERCDSWDCNLSSSKQPIISNQLLKTLAKFGKHIDVPSHVRVLDLTGLKLTSLWMNIKANSWICSLGLSGNEFEELNHETFGQYIQEGAFRRLEQLGIRHNPRLLSIDFDQMKISHMLTLVAAECTSLCDITNIPSTTYEIQISKTQIRSNSQLKFRNQSNLNCIWCDAGIANEFKESLRELRTGEELEFVQAYKGVDYVRITELFECS